MEKVDLKQFLKVLKWVISLYFQISPFRTVFLIIAKVIDSISGLVWAFIFGKLIDQISRQMTSQNPSIENIYPFLGYIFIYYLFFEGVFSELYWYCRRSLRYISKSKIEIIFYTKLNELGIQTLEEPEMQNRVKRADEWLGDSLYVLDSIVDTISSVFLAISTAIILFKYIPTMIPILAIYSVIRFLPNRYFSKQDFKWRIDNTEKSRMIGSIIRILRDTKELLEIKINHSYKFLDVKIKLFYEWYNNGFIKIVRNTRLASFGLGIGQNIFGIAGYYIIIKKTILNHLTLGDMLFQFRALDNFANALSSILENITSMYDVAIKMVDVVYVFEAKPVNMEGTIKLQKSEKPPEIEFQNVTFKYPNATTNVFENLNLKFTSGENAAIVGHNGAGKTTIVKLLARIYQVTSGKILINGIDINELDIESWYKHIGILFQEYAFYPSLTARENIIIGNPSKKFSEADVIKASVNAESHEFITEYKNGYNQIMSEQYEGGIRPSTGQKQKIAIARFFFRNPSLAIFDEPTSAIDAVSEYRIFNKIYKFFRKKTVLIISHRFSTVRNADKIFVINKGKLIEQGSHQMLMKQNGYYAKAFNLQAKGYQESIDT